MKTPESATDIKVGGKTSDEIKKGLKCCSKIEGCKNGGCSYYDLGSGSICIPAMTGDALAYIQQLESTVSQVIKALCGKENATLDEILQAANQLKSRLAQAERERDAAVEFLKKVGCEFCKHAPSPNDSYISNECFDCVNNSNFELRGVCPEAPKEQKT